MFTLRCSPSRLCVVVGLGNPGPDYAGTRHNAGARTVLEWAQGRRLAFKKNRSFKSFIAGGEDDGRPFWLVLPQTFMNLSGVAVRAVVRKKAVPAGQLLVVHDDVGLSLGTIRFKEGGSDGGHNGLASCIAHLGTPDFVRLRIGVGPRPAGEDLSDFVLERFLRGEEPAARQAVEAARQALTLWLAQGTVPCMNRYNRKEQSSEERNTHD